MTSQSLELLTSRDMTDSEDIRATTSKEVRSEMNPLTMDRLLCSIEALATTVARQDEKDRRRQEEDRRRQEEDRKRQDEKDRRRQEEDRRRQEEDRKRQERTE